MTTVKRNGDAEDGRKSVEKDVQGSHSKTAAFAATLDAAEACMRQLKLAKTEEEKNRLDREARSLLKTAEYLKNKTESRFTVGLTASRQPTTVASPRMVLKLQDPISTCALTMREQIILLEGSKLHEFVFPPWKESPSDSEFELKLGEPRFKDTAEMKLSDEQLKIFDSWRRPDEALPPPKFQIFNQPPGASPTMRAELDIDLIQDVTTDCSVVASLCAITARARRGHSKITSSVFYPYDHELKQPAFSPNGKYLFRMHFNGCSRKVVIDDLLPMSSTSRTLHVVDRRNSGLLWPALVEKAYLKVRGGYDFPGSNSGTDLWIMTGWIPEQIFLQSNDIASSSLWPRIFSAFKYGDVLATIGTGKLTEHEEEYIGLAGEHDYAILDVKEDGVRSMILIKNPWSKGIIWKGNTLAASFYGNSSGKLSDKNSIPETGNEPLTPGTFWMDLEDVIRNFRSMYLNWNPGLFSFRRDVHFTWNVTSSSFSRGSFAGNPQYRVYSSSGGTVWLLLNRHSITNSRVLEPNKRDLRADGVANGSYISLYAFDNDGEKVVLNDGAVVRGPYVDSPNTLLKLEWPATTSYTVVVSEQGLPLSTCNFTLSAFSLQPLSITEARDKYTHHQKHHGAWTFSTSGGNANSKLYSINPQFSIILRIASHISLLLECCEEKFPVHVKLAWGNGTRVSSITSQDVVNDSGEYRVGYAFAEIQDVQPGAYTIVCSTFEQGQLGTFTMQIGTTSPCAVERLPIEEAGRMISKVPSALFPPGTDRLVAPVSVRRVTRLSVIARTQQSRAGSNNMVRSPMRLGFEIGQGPSKQILEVSGNGGFVNDPSSLRIKETNVQPNMCKALGFWIVIERLGCSGIQDTEGVVIDILSDEPIEVGSWAVGDG